MEEKSPAKEITATIQMGANRMGGHVFSIMLATYGAGDKMNKSFKEFACSFFVGVARVHGIPECDDVNRMPEEGTPCFRRDVHVYSAVRV
jgi:hypothetical protein